MLELSRYSELAPPTLSRKRVCPPPGSNWGGGGTHSLVGKGVGGANSDEGTDTLVVLSALIPSLCCDISSQTLYNHSARSHPHFLNTIENLPTYVHKFLCLKSLLNVLQFFTSIVYKVHSYFSVFHSVGRISKKVEK